MSSSRTSAPSPSRHGEAAASHEPDAPGRPRGRWLLISRVGWVALALLIVGLDAYSIPIAFREAQVVCVSGACASLHYHQLTAVQAGALTKVGLSLRFYAAYVVSLDSLGTVLSVGLAAAIFWLRSDDRMALFAAYMLLLFGGAAAFGDLVALADVYPALALPVNFVTAIGQVAFYVFFCVFPSGRFVPRWVRWPALGYAVILLGAVFFPAVLNPLAQASLVFVCFLIVLVVAQVYRYRTVSTSQERQQTKWVVFGFAVGMGGFALFLTLGAFTATPNQPHPIDDALVPTTILDVLIWLVPISIAVAILRSKLWDIDVIIRRTLIYGTLTAVLAGVYFAVVVVAQVVGDRLTGQTQPPAWLIVVTTLVVAALFTPLRRRIQRVIDRRFYRSRYDAARTIAGFAAALRTELDLGELRAQLVGVVEETMRPARVSLWLARSTRDGIMDGPGVPTKTEEGQR